MPLTDVAVRNALPRKKPFKLYDGKGLYLLIQPSGGKLWRFKYTYLEDEKLLSLGVYPEVSLLEARKKAAQGREMLANGEDPGAARREIKRQIKLKAENKFEAIAREFHKSREKKWSKNYGIQFLRRLEADVFPKIGSRPIADVTAPDLLTIARSAESRGALDIAHRIIQMCGQVFNYAVITGRATHNPTPSLRGALEPTQKKHHAFLREGELPEFLRKLDSYGGDPITKWAFKLLLLTFVRTTELRAAKWEEISWKKREWRIPAERMKMREQHIVPLTPQAITVLRELEALSGEREYIFPNEQKGVGCMSNNTLLYALYRMGYHKRATTHGFRSTASTILNENGFNSDVIERQLAHAERSGVRAAYNHAQYLSERRQMMHWWADYLDQAITQKDDKEAKNAPRERGARRVSSRKAVKRSSPSGHTPLSPKT